MPYSFTSNSLSYARYLVQYYTQKNITINSCPLRFMTKKCRGEILTLDISKNYDYVVIDGTKLDKGSKYYIKLQLNTTLKSDNYFVHENEDMCKLVVKYCASTATHRKVGILQYREFEDIDLYECKTVCCDVYDVISPFKIIEYYDGVYTYLTFKDVQIDFKVHSSTFCEEIGHMQYKILYVKNNPVRIYNNNFTYMHLLCYSTPYKFNILRCNNHLQVRIFLTKIEEVYKSMNDYMKTDICDLINKTDDTLVNSMRLFNFERGKVQSTFVDEKLQVVDNVVIYNAISDYTAVVRNVYVFKHQGHVLKFDKMTLSLLWSYR